MEHIRRSKMCLHMRTRNPNRRRKAVRKVDTNNQGRNFSCSGDRYVPHPYEDKIHLIHAINDILAPAAIIYDNVSTLWHEGFIIHVNDEHIYAGLNLRCLSLETPLHYLNLEVHYAEKKKACCIDTESYRTLFSQKEGNQNHVVKECGNYIDHAHHLIEIARRSIAYSNNRAERKKHGNKLKLFKALYKLKDIKHKYSTSGIPFLLFG